MNIRNKTGWLAGLLSGWGIRESWAKIIAGALIGALAASGLLNEMACASGAGSAAATAMVVAH